MLPWLEGANEAQSRCSFPKFPLIAHSESINATDGLTATASGTATVTEEPPLSPGRAAAAAAGH